MAYARDGAIYPFLEESPLLNAILRDEDEHTRARMLATWRRMGVHIGWLGRGHPYPVGPPDAKVVTALLRLARDKPTHRTAGWHERDLCETPVRGGLVMQVDGGSVTLGDAAINVTSTTGQIFFAPTLIAHYVAEHHYQPPHDFLHALPQDA